MVTVESPLDLCKEDSSIDFVGTELDPEQQQLIPESEETAVLRHNHATTRQSAKKLAYSTSGFMHWIIANRTKLMRVLIAVTGATMFLVIATVALFNLPEFLRFLKSITSESVRPCSHLKVTDVWTHTFPKLLTESAVRILDVNSDLVDDVVIGFATGGDGYNISEIVCEVYFAGTHPCFGGVLALDGITGRQLWRVYTKHEIFALNCNADFNDDKQKDCVAAGRAGGMVAIDTATGTLLWTYNKATTDLSNFYTPQILHDLNHDGIPEILAAHGGDPLRMPGTKKINPGLGLLLILDGKSGQALQIVEVPDKAESYYSPQVYTKDEETTMVLFGSGGETRGGALWAIELFDLFAGNMKRARAILSDPFKGIMVPPVLVDITQDGIVDIVIAMFNSSIVALDGANFKELWRYSMPGSETYSTPAAGFFNDDDIPDFFVKYSVGPGYPIYYYSQAMVIDGRDGHPLLDSVIKDSIGSQSSPLTISVQNGSDFFLYWISDCETETSNIVSEFFFAKNANTAQKSRADLCKLRFRSSGFSQLVAVSAQTGLPGDLVYDSRERKSLEHDGWENTAQLGLKYLQKHPEWLNTKPANRRRRHVGAHDDEGIQRLISTGSLAGAFGENSCGAIDVVFATYLFYPSKTTVLLPEDEICVEERMKGENERFSPATVYYGLDHDAYENTIEKECAFRRTGQPSENVETFRDLFHLDMGSMTVYRLRLKCHDKSNLEAISSQSWGAYMGTSGDCLFHGNHVNLKGPQT